MMQRLRYIFWTAMLVLVAASFSNGFLLGAKPDKGGGKRGGGNEEPPTIAYSITMLGTLGGSSSRATGINNDGEVVGTSLDGDGNVRCFLYWDADGDTVEEMPDIGLFDGANSLSWPSINNLAQAAGHSADREGFIYRAWRFTPAVGMENLGVIKQNAGNIAESGTRYINDDGMVVGWSMAGGRKFHAFRYSDAKSLEDLGALGGDNSTAAGINNVFGDICQ